MPTRKRPPEEPTAEPRRQGETSPDDRDRRSLLHEVSVYQEELLVQNEALIHARSVLEETRDRFIELYDFAPNVYLTIDEEGIVRQCNLTATAFFGKSKAALEGLPLLGFVVPQSRRHYYELLRRCRAAKTPQEEAELAIRTGNGVREIQVLCRPRKSLNGPAKEYLTSIVDVTERNRLERERRRIASERAALAGRLISIQEEERQRIARNLHDNIGQQVTALRLTLEKLGMDVSDDALRPTLDRVQDMVETLDRHLHFAASELRPSALDLGIATAIDQFVKQWSATFGIPAAFHATGIPPDGLKPEIDTHLYRIAQEALNNVAKHAAARNVSVLLERRDDGVILIIEDDGRGFEADAIRQEGRGLGLVNMRERAKIIGGRLELETSPGNGTAVFLHVPSENLPKPA